MAIIGIDLGTTNSLCTVWRDGKLEFIPNAHGQFLTPSVVSVDETDEILVGEIARERLATHPERTAAGFKRSMGTDKAYALGHHSFLPEELSAMVLRQLKADAETYLGEAVTEAVISVPAYFSHNQRASTKLAGQLAGLTVDRLVNEPSAAALAYRKSGGEDGLYLVFDLGGGTLDVTVVDIFANIVDIIAIAGDNRLGGRDIDDCIVRAFFTKYPELEGTVSDRERAVLTRQAEQCKMALTTAESTCLMLRLGDRDYALPLDRAELIRICSGLLDRCRTVLERAMRDSGSALSDLTEVIAVGGSSKMPMILDYLHYLTGRVPRAGLDPDHVVAAGVGVATGIKARQADIRDMVLTDVCPFSLGIATLERDQLVFSPIIERNTALPASNANHYVTVQDGQTQLNIRIYQGEAMNPEKNLKLGELQIDVPPAPAGEMGATVRFSYDINGILDVDVHCPANQQSRHELLVLGQNLDREELSRRLEGLERLKSSPRERSENRLLTARAERVYAETVGPDRARLMDAHTAFLQALDQNRSPAAVERARMSLQAVLRELEDGAL